MTNPAEVFDARGNAAGPWWWFGKNLLVAADVLSQHTEVDPGRLLVAGQGRAFRTAMAILGPMLMLRACAIECLLKAVYLDGGNILAKDGRYHKPPAPDHDLVGLARLAGLSASPTVEAMLAKLQRWITAGRYPIETSWQRSFPDDASGYAWSEADEGEFVKFRAALFEQDERLSVE